MQIELQRQAQEVMFEVDADLFDQAQGLAVAAEQQMLAVVQLGVLVDYPACAPAKLPGALEYGDGNAALRQRDCCRHAGVAAADDGNIKPLPASPCASIRCADCLLAPLQGRSLL